MPRPGAAAAPPPTGWLEGPEAGAPAPVSSGPDGTCLAVLVVEDDDSVRAVLARVLVDAGYVVETARNGREALDRWEAARRRAAPFEAVVSDVIMPERGGRALARLLRIHRPTLPVVFLSGYVEGGMAAADLGGRTAFLEKPVRGAMLLAELAALLTDGRA